MPLYEFSEPGQTVRLKNGEPATIWLAEMAPGSLCVEKETGRLIFPLAHHEFREVPGHETDPDDD